MNVNIREIEIGGKARPVSYGMAAFLFLQRETGLTYGQAVMKLQSLIPQGAEAGDAEAVGRAFLENLDFEFIVQFMRAGLWNGARLRKQSFGADVNLVCDWLDEAGQEVWPQFFEVFVEAQPKPKAQEDDTSAPAKKK